MGSIRPRKARLAKVAAAVAAALSLAGSPGSAGAAAAGGREGAENEAERLRIPEPSRQQPHVAWNPAWRRFQAWEYATTPLLIAADIAIVQFVPDPDGHYRGGVLFDDAVLDLLRAPDGPARERAQNVSNYFHEATFLFGVSETPIAAALHGRWDVAFQTSLMNAEAFAAAGFVQLLSARLIGRERPYVERCAPGETDFPCQEGGSTLSFSSGHVMTSYVAAGLVCAHHSRLPLWGGGVADASACALAFASGTMTGLLRIMAEKHYPTDVLLGMVVGFGFGFGIPRLVHYTDTRPARASEPSTGAVHVFAPIPYALPGRVGLSWGGVF